MIVLSDSNRQKGRLMKLELKGEKKQNQLCHRRPEGERFKKGFAMSKTKCTPFKALAVKWHKWFANKTKKNSGA